MISFIKFSFCWLVKKNDRFATTIFCASKLFYDTAEKRNATEKRCDSPRTLQGFRFPPTPAGQEKILAMLPAGD